MQKSVGIDDQVGDGRSGYIFEENFDQGEKGTCDDHDERYDDYCATDSSPRAQPQ